MVKAARSLTARLSSRVATVLLEALDQALTPGPFTLAGAIERTRSARVLRSRDRHAHPALTEVLANAMTAPSPVGDDALRASLRAPAANAPPAAALRYLCDPRRCVAVARRDAKDHGFPATFRPQMDRGAEAALLRPKPSVAGSPFVPQRRADAHGRWCRQDSAFPSQPVQPRRPALGAGPSADSPARLPSAIEAAGDRADRAIPFRYIRLRRAGPKHPEDPLQHSLVLLRGAPSSGVPQWQQRS